MIGESDVGSLGHKEVWGDIQAGPGQAEISMAREGVIWSEAWGPQGVWRSLGGGKVCEDSEMVE